MTPPPPAGPRVLLVSSDPLVRAGLRGLLAASGWEVAAEASSLAAARSAARETSADATLWDAGHGEPPDAPEPGAPPVVALVEDERTARAALAVGLAGAVRRGSDASTLTAALHAAAQGLVVFEPGFVHLRPAPEVRREARPTEYTRRELEVLALLAEGLSNRAIANRLGISRHTVKFHVNALLQKLGVERRTEAVVRAARLGLVVL